MQAIVGKRPAIHDARHPPTREQNERKPQQIEHNPLHPKPLCRHKSQQRTFKQTMDDGRAKSPQQKEKGDPPPGAQPTVIAAE